MDFTNDLSVKSEMNDLNSEHFAGESIDLDFMVKVEIEADFHNFSSDEKLNVEHKWDSTENLYYNFIDHDTVEDSPHDGSFRSLQEFCEAECKICHKVFINRYDLIRHKSTHMKVFLDFPRMYQCDYCSTYFTEKNILADHIYSMHCDNNNVSKPEKLFRCSICDNEYNKYKNCHEHMISVHGKEKFECAICNVTFKCLRYLKTHNYYHHGRGFKPGGFKCKLCPKSFQYNDCLGKHVKNCHSSSVQCEICHSKLKSIVYLKTHMRRVHYNDGKIHKCDICSKQFKSPRYVRVHIKNTHAKINNCNRINNGNRRSKVYISCECGDKYRRVRQLESHLKVCAVALKL